MPCKARQYATSVDNSSEKKTSEIQIYFSYLYEKKSGIPMQICIKFPLKPKLPSDTLFLLI